MAAASYLNPVFRDPSCAHIREIIDSKKYNVFYHACHGSRTSEIIVPENTVIVQTSKSQCVFSSIDTPVMPMFKHDKIGSTLCAFINNDRSILTLHGFPEQEYVNTSTSYLPMNFMMNRKLCLLDTYSCNFPNESAPEKNISLSAEEALLPNWGTFMLNPYGEFIKNPEITKWIVENSGSLTQSMLINAINAVYNLDLNIHIFSNCAVDVRILPGVDILYENDAMQQLSEEAASGGAGATASLPVNNWYVPRRFSMDNGNEFMRGGKRRHRRSSVRNKLKSRRKTNRKKRI